jgi:hypothetical protein
MSMTISTRLEHKSSSKAKGMRHHCERSAKNLPNYIDKSRTHLNSILVAYPFESELRSECEALRSQRETKRAMKFDAAVLSDGLISFGTDAQKVINALSREKQDELFLETAKRLSEFCGSKLVGLTVHRDEQAIHAHYGMLAVGFDGKPLSKTLTPSRMSQMQEIAAAVWSDLGIERGERKSERIARGDDADKIYHRGVKQLHEDLPKEIKSLQDQVKSLELDRAWIDEQITQMGLEESARLQVAMARNSKLEAEIERKTGLLSSLNSSVTEMEAKKESLESRSSESQKRLKELEEAVLESQTKLDKNLRLIDGAQEKLESLLASADSIEERVKKAEKNLSIYEKRAQDAQKELEKARQEIEDITKAMAAVEPLESIQEPTVEEVEIISERKLMTTKIQRVKAVDASDMRDYIQKVTARESAIMSNAMSKAFAKAKGLDARERQIEWRECQLDEREEKLTKREKAITQREAELGINKQKQKQLGIEL